MKTILGMAREVGRVGVGAWEFQNQEQRQGNIFSASVFAPMLHISSLKWILSKQCQQNKVHQVYFSKCLPIPMFLLPGDRLCSLLRPTLKSWGRFPLDRVQVCYLDWKTKEGTMKKDDGHVFLMSFLFTAKLLKQ